MSVLVIVVNYRTAPLTIECLRSLEAEVQAHPATRVVVVDNASGDDSAGAISAAIEAQGWGRWARLVESPMNGGFSYGNNVGLRPALADPSGPDLFWLLNPDTAVRPGALQAMLDFFQARPDVGIVGSSIEAEDGKLWPYAFRFPSLLSELDSGLRLGIVSRLLRRWSVARRMSDRAEAVDWVSGASMMVRRGAFESVGLMDEDYFLYFEETDFCLQARRAGWSCWYVPSSRVMHIAGQSTGVTGKQAVRKRRPKYWFESRRRYFIKNHSRAYAMATDMVWIVSHALWRVRKFVQRKKSYEPPHELTDFVRNSSLATAHIDVNPSVAGR